MLVFNKKPFLIADISINVFEFADREKISYIDSAKFLIDEAKACGIDAVMFQSYTAENIVSRDASAFENLPVDSPNFYFDSIKKYDKFGVGDYKTLAEYCNDIGMVFYQLLMIWNLLIIWMNLWISFRFHLLI